MIPPEVQRVLKALQKKGFEAYLVGGAVRDLFLKRKPKDWDVATNAKPSQVEKSFSRTVATGKKYGTITVLEKNNFPIQVTTYRTETDYEKNRRPKKVKFVNSLHEDLARRDFTMNAMGYDCVKKIWIDPFGGKKDLKRKKLRTVREALNRFKEDALRPIRAARFISQLGLKPSTDLTKAACKVRKEIKSISQERVRDEISKLLILSKPSLGFVWMEKTGILAQILPEMLKMKGVRQGGWHQFDVFKHTLECLDKSEPILRVRLALLFHDIAKPQTKTKDYRGIHFYGHSDQGAEWTKKILKRLRFSKELIEDTSVLIKHHLFEDQSIIHSDAAVRRFIQRVGDARVDDLIRVRMGDAKGCGKGRKPGPSLQILQRKVAQVRIAKDAISIKSLAINGHEIMKLLGLSPGPEVGKTLQFLLDQVMLNPALNTSTTLKSLVLKGKS